MLISSRTRLTHVFGADGCALVDNAIHALAQAQRQMRSTVIDVDDADSLKPFDLQPVNPLNAWDIKLLIGQLAEKLHAAGDAIGALLIVGGPDIIPFHHLPNPTEDPDPDIPSDNPYATPDDNYFVPEWPLGRIPSSGQDPAPFIRALKIAAQHYTRKAMNAQRSWLQRVWAWLTQMARRRSAASDQRPAFGYSAHIWEQASAEVYDVIGDRRELQTCPPLEAQRLPPQGLAPARLSYFNLHGIEDGPEWYGQRAPDDPAHLPEYPIALRPTDIANSGRAPVVVFSEACYGANVFNKSTKDALCLRFLDSGTQALVGSTKIAYGSVGAPLIAADLLGRCFWQNTAGAGLPVGEALRLAKLQMAQEMHTRQGFLDGEDQKTLISFVLYGDPLAVTSDKAPSASPSLAAKRRAIRFTSKPPKVSLAETVPIESALSPETVAQIKSLVAEYLPTMRDAELRAARSRRAPATAKHASARTTVITLAKTVRVQLRSHPHYARVTFDENGKVIKLAVSR